MALVSWRRLWSSTVHLRRRPPADGPSSGAAGTQLPVLWSPRPPPRVCVCLCCELESQSPSSSARSSYTLWYFHRPVFFSVVLVAPAAGNFPRSPISSSVVSILGPPPIESQPCERYIGDSPLVRFNLVAFAMPLVVNLILRRGEYVERTRYWPPFSDLVSCRRVDSGRAPDSCAPPGS